MREGLVSALRTEGIHVPVAARVSTSFQQVLGLVHPDVALLGAGTPRALLAWLREQQPGCRAVVLGDGPRTLSAEEVAVHEAWAWVATESTSPGWLAEVMEAVRDGWRIFPVAGLVPARSGPLGGLSARELEVLRYIASGADNLKISACLDITERTVRAHVQALYRKLGGENRAQLALRGRELGVRPASDV